MMAIDRAEVLARTERHTREMLAKDTSGHDWWHVHRVRATALALAAEEGADLYVVEIGALLHDIYDAKFVGGDEQVGPQHAYDWLVGLGESAELARTIAAMIANLSFHGASEINRPETLEGLIVQDADRLDAIGAIGVARAFAFGGHAGQRMHDPAEPARVDQTKVEYGRHAGTTVNHFFEKLLLLKDRMNTAAGRRLAERRHAVLATFLDEFLLEWDGKDLTI